MLWYYQPHNQTMPHSLCLILHYVDSNSPVLCSIMAAKLEWLVLPHLIDIWAPLFDIMDEIV